jgi:hypothetical protein
MSWLVRVGRCRFLHRVAHGGEKQINWTRARAKYTTEREGHDRYLGNGMVLTRLTLHWWLLRGAGWAELGVGFGALSAMIPRARSPALFFSFPIFGFFPLSIVASWMNGSGRQGIERTNTMIPPDWIGLPSFRFFSLCSTFFLFLTFFSPPLTSQVCVPWHSLVARNV